MINAFPYAAGLIFLIAGLWILLKPFIRRSSTNALPEKEGDSEMKPWRKVLGFALVAFSLFFLTTGTSLFYAEPGYIYYAQYPTGGYSVLSTPGYHFVPLAKIYPWQRYITIKLSDLDDATSDTQDRENNSIRGVRFNDSVEAALGISVRFSLPLDEERFAKLHTEYRSEKRLIESTLVPSVYEAIRNSMRMLSAQEYVSGRGGILEEAFKDQLENGLYQLETRKKLVAEKIKDEPSFPANENEPNYNIIVEPKKDTSGNYIRVDTASLKDKGIGVSLAVIEEIVFEQAFLNRLEKQKEASTAAAQAAQEVKKAEQERLKVIAEGEKEKALEKAMYEKERIKIVTEAETERQRAEIIKRTAEIFKEKATIEAETKLISAEAEAKAKELIVRADNNLAAKLDTIKYLGDRFATAFEKSELVPKVVIGSNGMGTDAVSNSLSLFNIWMAEQLKLLDLELNVKQNSEK